MQKKSLNFRMQVLTTAVFWKPKLNPKLPSAQSTAQPLDSPPEAGRAPNLQTLSSARPLRPGMGTASRARALRVRTEQPTQRTRGEGGGVRRTTAGGLDRRGPDAECTPHRVRVALPAICDLLCSRPQSHGQRLPPSTLSASRSFGSA